MKIGVIEKWKDHYYIQSAGALIVHPENPDQVVLFYKYGNPLPAVPGGKADVLANSVCETPLQTALREVEEETCLRLTVEPVSAPFIEVISSHLFHCFCFKPQGFLPLGGASMEGIWQWGSYLELLKGSYTRYNKKMLQYYGYKCPDVY